MKELTALTKRHTKNYLRDKISVFFSFLSILILLAIYLLFLGQVFAAIPFLSDSEQARFTIGYIMGGVLVVATLTLSLGIIGTYVNDLESKRINSFLVTPIHRRKLIISYYITATLITVFLTLIMFMLSFLYLGLVLGVWYNLLLIMRIVGIIILYVCISTPIIVFLVTFIKSNSAFATLSTIIGTLIGFISGIYIPITVLGSFTKFISTLLPFSHMTMHLRKVLIGNDILKNIPGEYLTEMGIVDLPIFGVNVNIYVLFAIFIACSAGLLLLAYHVTNRKSK